jgi:hypothetical protein
MKFAAIEVKPGEMVEGAIAKLMHLAKGKGLLFSGLEQFDTFKINQTRFVRFRSDLDVEKLREALLADRGVILPHATDIRYEVTLCGGIKGTYSASAMHATPRLTEHKKYRGTGNKFWERQFQPTNEPR